MKFHVLVIIWVANKNRLNNTMLNDWILGIVGNPEIIWTFKNWLEHSITISKAKISAILVKNNSKADTAN